MKRTTESYRTLLDRTRTETAIVAIKERFQMGLRQALNLERITAPLLVEAGTGINDDLNGLEKPVSFSVGGLGGRRVEVVQSLAKWKRLALASRDARPGEGIYTDMNAIRPDEKLDELHSLYVDQWDWEKVIDPAERNLEALRQAVRSIWRVVRETERDVAALYPEIEAALPEEISFVHSSELQRRWPGLTPREREDRICEERGAVFVVGIGAVLADGRPHDGRAPDYDDWSTETGEGPGLNGDILVHNEVLGRAFEISSMGIRVDADALRRQLEITRTLDRTRLPFHRRLLDGGLPQTMGGGIGQSRLCMLYLRKAHIGEVQCGLWPKPMRNELRERNITLL